ncbi:MAG: hypothetical protein GVY19_05885 [Bacteroidetes bacterium]|jgi:gliding-associated putative ABC transporter substrate-binding component GldG|nr:hypothetical protein [Bacteroidota bacterium]
MKTKSQITYYLLLIFGIIILVNILSDRFFFRLDMTEDKRYTLSDATKEILINLPQPVTITAYFSEGASPELDRTRRKVKELLVEYSNISKGDLVFEMIDPGENQEIIQQAQEDGIQPRLIPVQDKNLTVPKEAYLGAVIKMGRQKEVLTGIQGSELEYLFSSTIKKMTVTDKPVIGFLQGHGEPRIQAMSQAQQLLSVMYETEAVNQVDSVNELMKYKTIAIVAPTDSFPPSHLNQLDEYLAAGNKLLIAINRVDARLRQNPYGEELTTGLEGWLAEKGITVEGNFVIDAQCGAVNVQQQGIPFPVQMSFPYLPRLSNFADHPITKGLEEVMMNFASSIVLSGDTTFSYTPLVKTSDKTGTEAAPKYFNIQREWMESDFPLSNIPVAAALEGNIAGSPNAQMVVFSDGDFAVNGEGQQGGQLPADNVNLFVNAVDWLSDDTGLIELRTKGAQMRPLDNVEQSRQTFLKYLNFFLPVIVVVIIGLIRLQMRQNLRVKRMEEGYV